MEKNLAGYVKYEVGCQPRFIPVIAGLVDSSVDLTGYEKLYTIPSTEQKPYRWMMTYEENGFTKEGLYKVQQRDDCGFGDYYPDQTPLYINPFI